MELIQKLKHSLAHIRPWAREKNAVGCLRVAVAVSGGIDSTALLLWARKLCGSNGVDPHLHVITVDHGLRPESITEASVVGTLVETLPRTTHVVARLCPPSKIRISQVQTWARKERYKVMNEVCAAKRVDVLFLGHHLDDQRETFLMRCFRGSGLRGLRGMEMISTRSGGGVSICRPFLHQTKAELAKICADERLDSYIVHDPSNLNLAFDRVRCRKALEKGIAEDDGARKVSVEHLLNTMAHLNAKIKEQIRQLSKECIVEENSQFGWITLDAKSLIAKTNENQGLAIAFLSHLVQCVGGGDFPPTTSSLCSLHYDLCRGQIPNPVHRCLFRKSGGRWRIIRSPPISEDKSKITPMAWRSPRLLSLPEGELWDKRVQCSVHVNSENGAANPQSRYGIGFRPRAEDHLHFPHLSHNREDTLSYFAIFQNKSPRSCVQVTKNALVAVPQLRYTVQWESSH